MGSLSQGRNHPNESFDGLGYFEVDIPTMDPAPKHRQNATGYKIWRMSRSPPPPPPPPPSSSPVDDDPYRYSNSSGGFPPGPSWRRNDSVNRLRYSSGDPNLVRFAEYNRVKDSSACAKERPQQYQTPPWDPSYTRKYLQEPCNRQQRRRTCREDSGNVKQRSKSASAPKRHGSMVSSYARDYGSKTRHTSPQRIPANEREAHQSLENPNGEWEGAKPYPVYAMQPAGNESDIEPLQLNQLESLENEVDDDASSCDESKNPLQRELEDHSRTAKQRFLHHFYSNSVAPLLGVGQQFLSRTYPVRVTDRQKMKRKYRQKGQIPGDYGDAEEAYSSDKEYFTSGAGNWLSLHNHKFTGDSETQSRYSNPWKLAMRQWSSAELQEHDDENPSSNVNSGESGVQSRQRPASSRRRAQKKEYDGKNTDSNARLGESGHQQRRRPALSRTRTQQHSFNDAASEQQYQASENTDSSWAKGTGLQETVPGNKGASAGYTPAERYSQHLYRVKNAPDRLSQLHQRHRDLEAKRSYYTWKDEQMRRRNEMEKQNKGKLDQYASTHTPPVAKTTTPETKRSEPSGNSYREALANALRNQLPADYF